MGNFALLASLKYNKKLDETCSKSQIMNLETVHPSNIATPDWDKFLGTQFECR
jgi:hypothetical protein